jgi:multicomponent Na+:H+ antiporter subunit C
MILAFSAGIGILFMAGSYLLMKHDLIRVVAGVVLISNAANLFIMAAALTRGRAPILPLANKYDVSDPVVQAMTLTAIVISFGVSALLLAIVYRVYLSHRTVDIDELGNVETRQAEQEERTELQDEPELPADLESVEVQA